MSINVIPMVPSVMAGGDALFGVHASVPMGGYAWTGTGFGDAPRERTAGIKQLPGTQVWSPPT